MNNSVRIIQYISILFITSCFQLPGSSLKNSFSSQDPFIQCPETFAIENGESLEGEYQLLIEDDFENHTSTTQHLLLNEDGENIILENFADSNPYTPGETIKVQGHLKSNSIAVDSVAKIHSPIQLIKSYDLKVLTVIMDFNNRKSSQVYSITKAKDDLRKLKDYTTRNSGAQMELNIDANGDGEPDVEHIIINGNFTKSQCTPNLDSIASSSLRDHDLSDYDTIIYVAADPSARSGDPICGYGGVAYVRPLGSGKNGKTHIAIPRFNVILHELGHTWGLGHSGKPGVTYAHKICPMGNSFDDKVTYFNGPKTKMLGLLDKRPDLERTIRDNGTYDIEAIGLGVTYTDKSFPRVITVQSATKVYYVDYRYAVEEDADMPSAVSGFKGINITEANLSTGGVSSYLAILNTSNRVYSGSGVNFELVGSITSASARLKLTFDSPSPNPTPGENTCDKSLVKFTTQSIKKLNNDQFEVGYEIENSNPQTCGELQFRVELDSNSLTLVEDQSIKINSQRSNIITKIYGSMGSTGQLILSEVNGKVEDLSLNIESASTCSTP